MILRVSLLFTLLLSVSAAPTRSSQPCRVLSLSGGGSYGAFEVGVLKKLVEENPELDYDYITGVSAGAMNTGFLSLYPKGNFSEAVHDLEQAWAGITRNEQIYTSRHPLFNILTDKSLFDTKPLRATVNRLIAGRKVVRDVTIGVTNIATGTQDQFSEVELSADTTTVVMASSAIPLIFPPIEYKGMLYSDGGTVANSIVVQGVDRCPAGAPVEVDIVGCDPKISQIEDPTKLKFAELAVRTVDIVDKALFSNFLRFKCTNGQTSNIKARYYAPQGDDNKISPLDFTKSAFIMNAGYSRATESQFDFCP